MMPQMKSELLILHSFLQYLHICNSSTSHGYRYGASARAAAAISGSHLSPFINNFSLLYRSSSLLSVAYSALGPISCQRVSDAQGVGLPLTLHNGVNRATLLAQAAVDTLGHIDIVASRPPASVHTLFSLNGDGLRRTDSLAKLAGNAALLACRIASQRVLASEAG